MATPLPPTTPDFSAPSPAQDEERWPYQQSLRGARGRVTRGMLAILALVVAGCLAWVAFLPLSRLIDLTRGVAPLDPANLTLTPSLLVANGLLVAAFLPISMLAQWAVFGVRARGVLSVVGQFRWRWLGRLAAVIVPVWAVVVLVRQASKSFGSFGLSNENLVLVALVLVITPLQSAGEEFAFRGLVQRSVEPWFRGRTWAFVISTAVATVLFATLHLATDPWSIAYYLVAGTGLSVHLSRAPSRESRSSSRDGVEAMN